MNKSVSIIIPAYNEEKKLAPTVNFVLAGLNKNGISDFEILIFNDASTDRTGEVADELAKKYPQIQIVHNHKNMNLGFNFVRGIELAVKEFVGMVPGDNEMDPETLDNVFNALGKSDIVVTYIQNTKVRPWGRRLLSVTYTTIINTAFGFKMRYYNGCCFFKTAMVKKVPVSTHGFAYMMEILVKLLKSGATFVEVPMVNRVREKGATKAFRLKNIISVFKTFLTLFWEVQILRKRIKLE
ncbi:hypothetical protein A2819_01105 [Candidatus Azambacteria bacterium RIFCSPHIGHO2_01_FULL_40_24]|uniref:Glycosyltransferase 2-like domain-containing protein n=2 Tax=Parcubacteria group TaxID=1794811 RepID=A0A1F5B4B4_9BACT|nr:MAG: hypothetical protein A2819_01105 [Candidatus Azambacteria bacterium RIFCSPHIGHO2_01_FULL_40_24]